MGPRFFKRGEKLLRGDWKGALDVMASMGPRFFKRGEHRPHGGLRPPDYGFNGATLLQAWRGFRGQGASVAVGRFNGATLLQAWRAHGQSPIRAALVASMGPRFFKRGETATVTYSRLWGLRFNGATLLQAWRDGARAADETRGDRASMGPRFFKRGELILLSTLTDKTTRLQWGHASSSVESRPNWGSSCEQWRRFNGATLLQAWRV